MTLQTCDSTVGFSEGGLRGRGLGLSQSILLSRRKQLGQLLVIQESTRQHTRHPPPRRIGNCMHLRNVLRSEGLEGSMGEVLPETADTICDEAAVMALTKVLREPIAEPWVKVWSQSPTYEHNVQTSSLDQTLARMQYLNVLQVERTTLKGSVVWSSLDCSVKGRDHKCVLNLASCHSMLQRSFSFGSYAMRDH